VSGITELRWIIVDGKDIKKPTAGVLIPGSNLYFVLQGYNGTWSDVPLGRAEEDKE
jgi:hypothetical protein